MTSFKFGIVCLVCAAIGLGGCASTGATTGSLGPGGGSSSPIQAQADDFKATVAEGAIAGALLGGITGAIVGKGDAKDILKGALIGGAAGAGVGYVVAGQKQQYASKEDALNSLIADGQQRNQKIGSILSTTDQVIAQRKQELARLKSSTATAEQKRAQQQALLASLNADKAAVEQAVNSAREHGQQMDQNITELKRQFPDSDAKPLDQVASSYRQNSANLERKPAELIKLISESSEIKVAS